MSLATASSVEDRLTRISGEIKWYDEQTRITVGLMLQYRLEVGRRLAEAKALLPHGSFLGWAKKTFGWTPRHVQNHLALAANSKQISRLSPNTSMNTALAVIRDCRAGAPKLKVEARWGQRPALVQRVHIIGEVEEGNLNCDQLIAELVRIAASLGAPKTKWKLRYPVNRSA